jgi:alkylation response protein AidB-like acyl-CoA dehydrogenase
MSITIEAFRAHADQVLAQHYAVRDASLDDERLDIIAREPLGHDAAVLGALTLQKILADAGLVGVAVPAEYGGQGLSAAHRAVLDELLARYDTPSTRPLGVGPSLAFHTLMRDGTEAQRRRYLPKIATGEERWCQLFSEPDAGSDLVSLRTKAERDGEEWVITGQKVWSSYADGASFGLLLARTNPDADRPHAGITMFVLPMDAPGVSVHPLVDMAGSRHFNEVFLNEVRLRDDMVIGELHRGWQVATGTLGGERSGYLGGSGNGRRHRQVRVLGERYGRFDDPVARAAAVSVIAEELLLEWLRDRIVAGQVGGGNPAVGSLIKLAAGNLEQKVTELNMTLAGPAGAAWDAADVDGDVVAHHFCAARQATIAGGTHQIQRNLLGERVLGLPRG